MYCMSRTCPSAKGHENPMHFRPYNNTCNDISFVRLGALGVFDRFFETGGAVRDGFSDPFALFPTGFGWRNWAPAGSYTFGVSMSALHIRL